MFILFTTLTACFINDNNREQTYNDSNNANNSTEHSLFYGETLTITTPWESSIPAQALIAIEMMLSSTLNILAERYMDENPGVNVIINTLTTNIQDVHSRMNVELMAGQADILLDMSTVPWRTGRGRDLFVDWFPIITFDPRFDEDNYFMNVFDAIAVDGRMHAFPISINFHYMSANRAIDGLYEALIFYESITLEELYKLHNIFSCSDIPYIAYFYDTFEVTLHNIHSFLDIRARHVAFTVNSFIDLLNRAQPVSSGHRNLTTTSVFTVPHDIEQVRSMMYLFDRASAHSFVNLMGFEQEFLFKGNVPLVNNERELLIDAWNGFVLNENATPLQRALAWDFVYFSMQPENRDGLTLVNHAIYKPLFFHQTRLHVERTASALEHGGIYIYYSGNEHDESAHAQWLEMLKDSITYKLYNFAEMPMRQFTPAYVQILGAINTVLSDFHDGIITAEQAAIDIQNRVSLLIMELGI